ncbi:EamA family transporter [Streptomyces sp. NBC_00669]|uniref:EamA family transporter n=1 Tax=Streptomyces sp. NBC_00669 TaxID=2976011 RepID=UPI002E30AAC4|nr:EamA family transporter [Streptomyces sp. NBC_00669]
MSLPNHRATGPRLSASATGALMAVTSMSAVQLGLALSVPLVDRLGALGTTGLRMAWAGVLLLVLVRPRPRDFTGRDLRACTALGAVSAGMMICFMLAVARLPLGTASALEFLGPLAVSLHGSPQGPSRGRIRWAAMAALGVVALTEPWHGGIDAAGAGFAVAAASCWAAYILLTQRVGDSVTGLGGLAVSMPVAGLVGLLAAAPSDLAHVTWRLLAAMLGLAALSAALPFALEFLALRRLTTSAFGTLMSLEPAVALLAGLLVLGQIPALASAAGVALVVTAGIGATRTGVRPSPAPPEPHHALTPTTASSPSG